MKRVIIMSGVSGSGKSTWIKENFDECMIVSADHFFMKGDEYKFNPMELGDAHAYCFAAFIQSLRHGVDTVVVDNTNTENWEISPYILGAAAYGYPSQIITLMCQNDDDVRMCAGRNAHGVPFASVIAQHRRIYKRTLPRMWQSVSKPVTKG